MRPQDVLPLRQPSRAVSETDRSPGGALTITMRVNGDGVASGTVPVSAPLLFSANDCLDIGPCLGGAVSLDYYEEMPFAFNGTIDLVDVRYLT